MGVESKFYILPAASGYRPDASTVCQLIRDLRVARFLADPASSSYVPSAHPSRSPSPPDYEGFEWQTAETGRQRQAGALVDLENVAGQHDQSDLLVYWHTSDLALSGLKYPLSVIPMSAGVYYDIEIHLTANTVYHTSEIIEPFADISCGCGAAIERVEPRDDDPLHDERLPNNCPACREAIDYAVLPMTIRDGWTGVETAAVGGVTYRFAVVIDCGKCWPDQNQDAVVLPEFLSVIRQRLKTNTRVVRDFY